MRVIVSKFPMGSATIIGEEDGYTPPAFTYSGTSEFVAEGGENWKIRLLTSGKIMMEETTVVDIFLVGAGGGAGTGGIGGGGGGGYTKTVTNYTIEAGKEYEVTIGAGGAVATAGGTTYFTSDIKADGGASGSGRYGGNGGSGGGLGSGAGDYGYAGGSDGNNGDGFGNYKSEGQGTTTREFGESTGTLYAGGGGGGANNYQYNGGAGGSGGGGRGSNQNGSSTAGGTNTGGGGGGGGINKGAAGGSGIVVIRNARG